MHVVGHETIGEDIYAIFLYVFIHPLTILLIIIIVIKSILLVIASLSYVVGCSRYNYSCLSWHAFILHAAGMCMSRKRSLSPFVSISLDAYSRKVIGYSLQEHIDT